MKKYALLLILFLPLFAAQLEAQPDPQGSLTANGPFCVTGSGMLTWTATAGTGPYTVVYKENGGADRTAASVVSGIPFASYTPTVTVITLYKLVSVTDESNSKVRSNGFTNDEATITIDQLPVANVSGSKTICENGTASVSAGEASASYGTIQWTEDGAGSITAGATTLTPAYSAAAGDGGNTVTLTMTVTSNNSCGSATASDTYSVFVEPLPVANVTGSKTICENGTATVGAGEASASYGTIQWTENGAGSITAGATGLTPTYTAAPGDAGATVTLTMTVTSNNSCGTATVSDTYTVNVNALPTANVSGSKTICENGTATVGAGEASATNGTIQWTENGAGSITAGATTLTPTYSAASGDAGATVTLTMTVTSNNTCGTATASDTYTINIDPLPVANVSGSKTICENGTATVSAGEASALYGTILWTENGAGSITAGATTLTPTYTAATGDGGTTVTLTMTVTSNNSCGTATTSDTYSIIVDHLPVANVSGSKTICQNGTATVSAGEANASYGTIQWTENGAGSITAGATGLTPTYTAAAGDAGTMVTLTMTVTSNNTCGTATSSDTYAVNVDPFPVANVSGSKTTCEDGTATVGAGEASASYGTIQWTENGAGSITAGATTLTPTYTAAAADAGTAVTLTMTVTSNNTCGTATASDTYTININPSQTLSGASQAAQICSGSVATIHLNGLLSGTTFTIHYSIAGVAQTPVNNITADGTGAANFFTGILTPDNNGKTLTITGITTTNPSPDCYKAFSASLILIVNTANTPILTGNFSPCVNSTGNIYTTEAGMTNYTWIVSGGGAVTAGGGTTNNTVTVTWNTAGAQSVSVNYTNSNGCTSVTPTVKTVTVNSLPTPIITGTSPVCITSSGNIYTTETDKTSYTWNVSPGNLITSGTTGNMVIVTWNASGSQSINVNYTDAKGCRASAAVVKPVTVNSLPVPSLTGSSSVCATSTGNLYSTTAGMSNYTWTVSAGGTITAGGGTTNNTVTVTWNTPGAQKVMVNYTDGNGCTASSATELNVTVNPLPVPSVSGPASPNVNTSGNVYSTEALITGYNWTVSAGGSITAGAGTNSITVTWSGSGSQTVAVNYTNTNSCTAASVTVYNVTVNALPVAGTVKITGDTRSGITLYGSYVYTDADGDAQGAPTYQWYTGTSSGGAGSAIIPLATSSSFKLTDTQLGKYIGFSVIPSALTGATPGIMATTLTWVGPVINDLPVATIQPITGTLNVNALLTGHYVYSDTEGDIESGTLYQWYSSTSSGGIYNAITGETNIAHVITNSEQGKYFKIYITPVAATGTITGIQAKSTAYGPANTQPVASNVKITGTAAVGSTLEGSYDFSDVDPADLQGTSTFRWLKNGTIPISGATAQTYLVTAADEGYKLSFEVTPVSLTGFPNTGTPVQSAQTVNVIDPSPLTPVASQVCVEGIRTAGQILRGKYYYDFYKSEGTSTYQWYRNSIPISGATGIQYTLKQVEDIDSNADITFEVTPKSSNIPAKAGASVTSNPLARIIIPKDQYSVSESDVILSANVLGGVFSGTGVTGNIFSPKSAGSAGSPYTLSYLLNIVNTAHNCSQQASKIVAVNPNVSSFVGFDPLYCHDSGPDVITVSGVPSGPTTTIIGFTISDNKGIVSQSGTTVTIDPGRMRPGIDKDVLYFSYFYLGTFYQINQSFKIDSVGTQIRILNLDAAYCQNDPKKYISIEGMYPLGGTATWTGDILSDTKAGSAYADPSLVAPGSSYPISYQYRSPDGCYSSILKDTVEINRLPDPSFPLDVTYNIDGGSIPLVPVQSGGTFRGNGVSGDKMFPDIAGLGEHEITYIINDVNKCSASFSRKTTIRKAQGAFIDIPSVICYSDTTFNVKVTGLPSVGVVTVTGFTNKKNSLVYTPGDTDADYNVPAAGEGFDTLFFSYNWDGVGYSISKAINVDSLGQVTIDLTPGQKICNNNGLTKLHPLPTGGIFSGPVLGDYLDPSMETGSTAVSYTYSNAKTGCSISGSVPVTIYPAPEVHFAPVDICINNDSDTTFFMNKSKSDETVEKWLWQFMDAGVPYPDSSKNAGYLYKTGGLQKISLKATTINGCSATIDTTVNLGRKAEANFTWKSDCMHPGDSIILSDKTVSTSPIASRTWKLFNGPEFGANKLEARYPKSDTGYIRIQYIVKTTYANCNDTVTKNIYIKPAITIQADGYLENFESGNGGWIKGETENNTWSFGLPVRGVVKKAASGTHAWYTNFSMTGSNKESSSIVSPCFDFKSVERPLIKLDLLKRFTRDRDGASLQYRIGDSDDWHTVGAIDDGIEWYNSAVIRGGPGGNQLGWTTRGNPDTSWVVSIHTLDELKGKSDVVFRIAYGSDGSVPEYEGIFVDSLWIGERSRNILLEHFTNLKDNSGFNADALVDTIVKNSSDDVLNIQYHTNFPETDPYYDANPGDAGARILFYGLIKTPYTFIDGGTQKDYAYMYSYASLNAKIDSNDVTKRSLIPSRFDISLTIGKPINGVLTVNGKITALENITSGNLTLFVAVTEKKKTLPPAQGGKEFWNIFRKFIPDAGGILLKSNWTKGESVSIAEQKWLIDKILNNSDIEIIAFIQDAITKEIYQASSVSQPDIVVGIEDPQGRPGNGFILYPNPVKNRLAIGFVEPLKGDADIRIFDIQGIQVAIYKAVSGTEQFTIDDLSLKQGLYMVHISRNGIDLGYRKLVVAGR